MAFCWKSAFSGAMGGLVASLAIWSTLHFQDTQRERTPLSQAEQDASLRSAPLFVHKGQTVSSAQLSSELRLQFERATSVRSQSMRDAELQFYKEVDKISRLHILEKELAAGSNSKSNSNADSKVLADREAELLPREEASIEDARGLYEASDPSAPREGFAPVKNQLIGYLNEVRRREALETWTNGLRDKGEWKMLLSRPFPLPELSSLNLLGLPKDGKGHPNALVFVDYLCNNCSQFLVEFAKRVEDYRGELQPVYIPFPYTKPERSMALARGALCAQQLGEFSSFHMAALTKGELLSEVSVFDIARQSEVRMGEFKACYRSGEGLAELLGRAQGLARNFGLMQTPAIVYQGQLLEGSKIIENFDALLKSAPPQGQLTKRGDENKRRGPSQP
ncbi:MAG: DsbA family protein [Silvanigrellaceae bacterium]